MRGKSIAGAFKDAASPYPKTLRRLHLAIVGFVIVLAVTGFMIYFRKPLGLQELKLKLVFVHAVIAYFFLAILAARFYLGLCGGDALGLKRTLPRVSDIRRLVSIDAAGGSRIKFAGRSPLSRTIAGVLYAVIAINATTGLVRAGTDLYFPPFGHFVRGYVVEAGVEPALVKPSERDYVNKPRFALVSRAKIPFGKVHIYGAFVIIGIAFAHALGVAATEWSAPNDRAARGRARLMLFGPRR